MALGISVVIPSYNCLEYLPLALQSVWQQTEAAAEVWVVDDGSDDGTIDYLQQQQLHHPNLFYLRLERVGVSAARNAAIALCRCPWIAFLDADDVWTPDKLRLQRRLLQQQPHIALLFSNYQHIDEQRRAIVDCFSYWPRFQRQLQLPAQRVSLTDILAENVVGTSTVIASKAALLRSGGFDTQLGSASDWDLWLKLAQTGAVWCQQQQLMEYLMRANSISCKRLNRLQAMAAIIERHQHHSDENGVQCAQAALARGYSEYHEEMGQYWLALKYQLATFNHHLPLKNLKRSAALCLRGLSHTS
ncbi:glycosyltransferase family A protein [uncultured Ferrimonas sp.]|uniref:glycosyltransferase family 2 protein n=1 Tax=uncultured Ferrimonas sp. TaxID=432640 RepID=UPI00262D4E4C|nr:glycosyltransferase family A protein [uncultured Ferrimonas sp.]